MGVVGGKVVGCLEAQIQPMKNPRNLTPHLGEWALEQVAPL